MRTIFDLRKWVFEERQRGFKIGLVPTMGSIHPGHLALVKLASSHADSVVASIFVNPLQFSPDEDFDQYPRDEVTDRKLLESAGVKLLFAPSRAEIYQKNHSTVVDVGILGKELEGEFRPKFFSGVATIVTKLFIQVLPDIAIFGEKDYQQLCVVRRLVEDLNLPVDVIQAGTVRENDGLAISSRNRFLSEAERKCAPKLYEGICAFADEIISGRSQKKSFSYWADHLMQVGFGKVDYMEARQNLTLDKVEVVTKNTRVLGAAWLGKVRLIDNVAL